MTAGDGSYSVRIAAKDGGASATVTVSQTGKFFSPDQHTVSAVAGANISGINFTAFDNGTINGRVVDVDDNPISGVVVSAMPAAGGAAAHADTTGTTGSYTLSVRYGQYNVTAAKAGYTFTQVDGVNVPNDGKAIDDIEGTAAEDNADLSSLSLSGVSLCQTNAASCPRGSGGFESGTTTYYATVHNNVAMTTVRATAAVAGANVTDIYPGDADGDLNNGHQVELGVGLTTIEVEVTAKDGETTNTYRVHVTRRAPSTVITGTITDGNGDGVSAVQVRVTGATLLNGGRNPYVSTNSSGEYEAIVESTSSTGTVTPSKTGYTFEPSNRAVSLQPNSDVTGVDFTGSAYATISGTVMAGTTPLEGVAVMGTSTGGGTPGSATTDRRGNFSFSVASGTVTITATKTGYTFGSQSVFVGAGEARSVGTITATGNMAPLNVEAERDTASTGLFETTVTVGWTPGPGGRATQYQAQIQDTLGEWTDVGGAVTDPVETVAPDSAWMVQFTPPDESNPEGTLTIRVMAQHDHDGDGGTTPTVDYPSDAVTVAAVDPTPSNVAAKRDIDDEPDSLVVTWDAEGNTNSAWRVVISFDGGATWYEAGGTAASGMWGRTVSDISGTTPVTATNDGTAGTAKAAAVTDDEINGALMFRVDARQGTVSADNPWKLGPTVSLPAK